MCEVSAAPEYVRACACTAHERVTRGHRVEAPHNELLQPLTPCVSQLFSTLMQQAVIPQEWKFAKIASLYKKGSITDAGNHRMLA
eukprot:1034030-Pelagomonas_calceolata.AAC.1